MAAYNDKSSLLQRLIQLIRSGGAGGKTSAKNLRDMFTDVIDTLFAKLNSAAEVDTDLAWVFDETYNLTDNQFAVYQLRLYKSKSALNIGNEPPTVPDVDGIYQDEYWLEVSPAPKSGISEWQAGTYGNGLVIVYKDDQLWRLTEAIRPFESSDFAAEVIAEKWIAISGPSEGTGGGGGSFALIEPYHFIFDSELDTVSAAITLKGTKTFTAPDFSSNINAMSFQVKLDASGSYTAAADVTALNSWITSNVTTTNTKFQLRLIATYTTGTGEGSAVIRTTETITLT